jgi:hypothetical protein
MALVLNCGELPLAVHPTILVAIGASHPSFAAPGLLVEHDEVPLAGASRRIVIDSDPGQLAGIHTVGVQIRNDLPGEFEDPPPSRPASV